MRAPRAAIAVAIVLLWAVGMASMLRRNANRSEAQQLAEVALRLQPATFYYTIERDGRQIGAASSAVDTTANALVSEEYFVGDYPVPGGKPVERTSARWQTRLTRVFRLQGFTVDVARPTRPFAINASVEEDTTLIMAGTRRPRGHPPVAYTFSPPLFTPTLAPIAFMLGGPHEIGRKQTMAVFDPITRGLVRRELTIRAESLFTVVDSAAIDNTGSWSPAHRDTVRAWRIDGAPHGLTAWVDAEGRIVTARAGSLSATRTAFEIAFKNPKDK
ncbi:MAG TPA: hypothetical protein VGO75_04070 [Gemmatimonadaceae bacterium]|nr:hypothetical protein [Gemmatimonadaceae bacterium]